ncbi:MAG: stage III sporulation protein AF [Firmicutes bacterium HGW-Firmicutes-12]|nr:MAG: stage III sporulation protein AF [Firmicutes bacterium HGW-Firmicutes-12]
MEVFKELIRDIVLIIMLTTFLDMLLPSNSMRPYLKMVMGLFILVSIINPVLNLILNNQDLEVFAWQQDSVIEDFNSIKQAGEELTAVSQEQFIKNYASQIEVQMEGLLKYLEGVKAIDVKVELLGGRRLGSFEGIKSIMVILTQIDGKSEDIDNIKIEPIEIGDKHNLIGNEATKQFDEYEENKIAEEVNKVLCQYFGVTSDQISVVFAN